MNGDTKPLLLCRAVPGDIISVRIIVIVLLALSSVQLIHHNYNLHSSATTTNINSSLHKT